MIRGYVVSRHSLRHHRLERSFVFGAQTERYCARYHAVPAADSPRFSLLSRLTCTSMFLARPNALHSRHPGASKPDQRPLRGQSRNGMAYAVRQDPSDGTEAPLLWSEL